MKFKDGRVMCQLCFGGFTLEELANADEPGFKTDVCKPCDKSGQGSGTLQIRQKGNGSVNAEETLKSVIARQCGETLAEAIVEQLKISADETMGWLIFAGATIAVEDMWADRYWDSSDGTMVYTVVTRSSN